MRKGAASKDQVSQVGHSSAVMFLLIHAHAVLGFHERACPKDVSVSLIVLQQLRILSCVCGILLEMRALGMYGQIAVAPSLCAG